LQGGSTTLQGPDTLWSLVASRVASRRVVQVIFTVVRSAGKEHLSARQQTNG
jgi:hypothetical protein